MKKLYATILAIIFLLSGFNTLSAQLDNSPWPMFHHDLKHTGRSPYNGPETPELYWKFMTNGEVDSSPAIGSDGTIYVGSDDNYFYAVNPDGTEKWKFMTNGDVHSTPAIGSDGTVYVGSNDDYFYAINPDGTEKWKFPGWDFQSSPAIESDGTVYVGSQNNYLYAINPDGSEKWKYLTNDDVNSSPVAGSDGTVYVGSRDDYLYAINPDGSLKWTYMTNGDIYYSSPAIGSDGTIYFGSLDNYLYAINPDGSEKWKFMTNGDIYQSSPGIGSDGTVYVGSRDDYLYAINPDGSLNWKFKTDSWIDSSPAIGSDGTIYVGSCDNYLYAINPDGSEKWKYQTNDDVQSSPAIGSDGSVYFGSDDNYLYAIYVEGPTPTPTTTATPTQTMTITPTLTVTATTTQTETPTPTLTQTSSFTLTATPTQTQSSTQTSTIIETLTQTLTATPTPTITQTPSQTITMTPTLTATSTATQTQTLTATPTLTATETSTQTLTSSQSNTSTQTPTITETPSNTATPTITWFDFSPSLDYGNVLPERGNPNTTFEYLVHFCDPDGGYAPLTRIYINNGIYKTMHLKTGISCDGWYYFLLPGTALNIGNNEYYFLFIDNEGNSVRLPTSGNFMGPLVEIIENPTATQTPTQTLTVTPSPTESPIPDDCLVITSPIDFYCNSVLISWTPILNASYYTLEYDLHGELYSARMTENFVRINLPYQDDWKQYVDVGAVPYRVTAYDNIDRIIDGPTAWSHLVCQPDYVFPTIGVVNVTAALGCLRISNPQEFYYNTILLSWTPITGADHYLLEYKYKGEIYNVDLYSNWLRSIISDKEEWNLFTSFVAIEYRVSAVDSRGNIIDGPTPWMSFTCY